MSKPILVLIESCSDDQATIPATQEVAELTTLVSRIPGCSVVNSMVSSIEISPGISILVRKLADNGHVFYRVLYSPFASNTKSISQLMEVMSETIASFDENEAGVALRQIREAIGGKPSDDDLRS